MAGAECLTSTGRKRVIESVVVSCGCERSHARRPDDCYVNARQQTSGYARVEVMRSHSYVPDEFLQNKYAALGNKGNCHTGCHYFTIENPTCQTFGWANFFPCVTSDRFEPSRTPQFSNCAEFRNFGVFFVFCFFCPNAILA